MTVIAEARHVSPDPHTHGKDSLAVKQISLWNASKQAEDLSSDSRNHLRTTEQTIDRAKSSNFTAKHGPGASQPGFLTLVESYNTDMTEEMIKDGRAYPPFPCPFCDRAYTSWGFRRRHIKAVHTISPSLNCKWCLQVSESRNLSNSSREIKSNRIADACFFFVFVFFLRRIIFSFLFRLPQILPTHAAWRRHVISAHNLSASDAHNGLLILEEAHMVLQIARPTRLDTLVNIIKQSSQQSNDQDTVQPDKD